MFGTVCPELREKVFALLSTHPFDTRAYHFVSNF
jgi:hypothetical protein